MAVRRRAGPGVRGLRPLSPVLALVVAACASVTPTATGRVDRAAPGEDALRLVYLGNGGWIIEHGEDMVLTGPLFSNPDILHGGLGRIRSDTVLVDRYMSRYDVSRAEAILVGHGHYDHLMDVPRTAVAHAPAARIVGSRTVKNLLGTWSGLADRVDLVEGAAGDQRHPGRWLRYGRIRVMPLRSHHGPHFAGYTLFQGTVDVPFTEEPRWARDWVDGESYAFLIDFMTPRGDIAYRVFYQDAVAEPPYGFAPHEVIAERGVDVAIIVPSTFEEVPWHPEALIDNLKPRRILLGHWEDFFVPVSEPMRPSPPTDHAEFERRLRRVFAGEWWRPARWTEFRFGSGA